MITNIHLPNTSIHALQAGDPQSDLPPVILVHGAYCDGRMWVGNFLDFFAEQGHATYAIHLKDPYRRPTVATLFSYSLETFALRLHELVTFTGTLPILIGHSMGGLVIQKYLSLFPGKATGAGLLASLPPFGMKNTVWGMVKEPDLLLAYTIVTLAPSLARKGSAVPRGLLSDRVGKEKRKNLQNLLVQESGIALTNCLSPGILPDAVRQVPIQVWGAELDNLALPQDVEQTASHYQVQPTILPNTGHFLVYEPEWKEIAEEMRNELSTFPEEA